jgi:PEP-CTERM motif
MKLTLSTLAAAVVLFAGPVAFVNAQTLVTLESGGDLVSLVGVTGLEAPGLQFIGGAGRFDFSQGQVFLETGDPFELAGAMGTFSYLTKGDVSGTWNHRLSGTNGATVDYQWKEDDIGQTVWVGSTWQSPAATTVSLVKDGDKAGQVETVSLMGGLSLTVPTDTNERVNQNVASGGAVQINNVRVNLGTGQVLADLTGTRLATDAQPAVSFSSPNTVLWKATSVTGPTQITPEALLASDPAAALAAKGFTVIDPHVVSAGYTSQWSPNTCDGSSNDGYSFTSYSCEKPEVVEATKQSYAALLANIQLNELEMTPEGMQFLADSLGLKSSGLDALANPNRRSGYDDKKWGSLTVGVFFRAVDPTGLLPAIPGSVPEPSTYALMGVGLLGIWGVSRSAARRRSA